MSRNQASCTGGSQLHRNLHDTAVGKEILAALDKRPRDDVARVGVAAGDQPEDLQRAQDAAPQLYDIRCVAADGSYDVAVINDTSDGRSAAWRPKPRLPRPLCFLRYPRIIRF